jgi:hypothetical protein
MAKITHGKASIEIKQQDENFIFLISHSILFIQLCNQEIEKWKTQNNGTDSLDDWQRIKESHIYSIQNALKKYNVDL